MSSTDPFDRMRFTVRRVSWWQVAIVVAVALAVGTALALVAASVFLVVFPVVAIAGLAYRLFGRRPAARREDGPNVIEAEYRVLSPEEAAREADPRWSPDRRLR
ncbi:hypothetical protein [Ancylobacter amanitiformis]|uniref:DUF2244 domain-containing protein n=1 Tax=Ancylobacter amanitiformis TaxID=217069 RepID=A0ABU0LTL6_9HYPH|nr:hypothetical protein [Ancylobacter amanitiformis]MDQ0512051.1 hypothetical protein [Ancylobacter amanitiformis]